MVNEDKTFNDFSLPSENLRFGDGGVARAFYARPLGVEGKVVVRALYAAILQSIVPPLRIPSQMGT
jgi:hypothetical protein